MANGALKHEGIPLTLIANRFAFPPFVLNDRLAMSTGHSKLLVVVRRATLNNLCHFLLHHHHAAAAFAGHAEVFPRATDEPPKVPFTARALSPCFIEFPFNHAFLKAGTHPKDFE